MNNNTNKSSNHSIFVDPPSCDVINGVTSLAVTPSAINPAAASRASGQALWQIYLINFCGQNEHNGTETC